MSCAATLLALAHTVKAPSAHNKARLSRNGPIFLASGATSGACTAFTSPDKRTSVANAISRISEVYLPASKVTANIVRKLNTFKPQPTPQVVQEHHSHGRLTIENLTVAAAEIARPLEVPIYNHALLQTWDPPAAAAVVTRSPRFRQPRSQVAAMTSLPLVKQSAYPAIFSHALLPNWDISAAAASVVRPKIVSSPPRRRAGRATVTYIFGAGIRGYANTGHADSRRRLNQQGSTPPFAPSPYSPAPSSIRSSRSSSLFASAATSSASSITTSVEGVSLPETKYRSFPQLASLRRTTTDEPPRTAKKSTPVSSPECSRLCAKTSSPDLSPASPFPLPSHRRSSSTPISLASQDV
ncbi:hypothetical protein JCM11641_005140 [Rhodosporidiobolus odoratus]